MAKKGNVSKVVRKESKAKNMNDAKDVKGKDPKDNGNGEIVSPFQVIEDVPCFSTGLKAHDSCPHALTAEINIPFKIWYEVKAIQAAHPTTEFLVYFKGSAEGNVFNVTEMSVPKQEVTTARVIVLEPEYDVIGVLHKHPKGINRFSSTDDETVNANHGFSILIVDGSDDITATARVEMPCGCLMRVDAKVNIITDDKYKYEDKILPRKYSVNRYIKRYRAYNRYPYMYGYQRDDVEDEVYDVHRVAKYSMKSGGKNKDKGKDPSAPLCDSPVLGMPCDIKACTYWDHFCTYGCPGGDLGEPCDVTECLVNYGGTCYRSQYNIL